MSSCAILGDHLTRLAGHVPGNKEDLQEKLASYTADMLAAGADSGTKWTPQLLQPALKATVAAGVLAAVAAVLEAVAEWPQQVLLPQLLEAGKAGLIDVCELLLGRVKVQEVPGSMQALLLEACKVGQKDIVGWCLQGQQQPGEAMDLEGKGQHQLQQGHCQKEVVGMQQEEEEQQHNQQEDEVAEQQRQQQKEQQLRAHMVVWHVEQLQGALEATLVKWKEVIGIVRRQPGLHMWRQSPSYDVQLRQLQGVVQQLLQFPQVKWTPHHLTKAVGIVAGVKYSWDMMKLLIDAVGPAAGGGGGAGVEGGAEGAVAAAAVGVGGGAGVEGGAKGAVAAAAVGLGGGARVEGGAEGAVAAAAVGVGGGAGVEGGAEGAVAAAAVGVGGGAGMEGGAEGVLAAAAAGVGGGAVGAGDGLAAAAVGWTAADLIAALSTSMASEAAPIPPRPLSEREIRKMGRPLPPPPTAQVPDGPSMVDELLQLPGVKWTGADLAAALDAAVNLPVGEQAEERAQKLLDVPGAGWRGQHVVNAAVGAARRGR